MKGNGGWREFNESIKIDNRKNERHCRRSNDLHDIVNGNRKDIAKFSFLNRTNIDWNAIKVIDIRDVK